MLPYKYDKEALKLKLLELVAKGKPHKHYEHTVKYAERMTSYKTGENQEELIVTYKNKENDTQKKQRIRLNNTRTQFVTHKIDNSLSELENVDPAISQISYGKEAKKDKEVKSIEDRIKYFSDGKNLQHYAFHRIKDLNEIDPNAFIVVEQNDISEQHKNYVYPLEIYSHEAWQFEKAHGMLQYLIARVYEDVEIVETSVATFLAKEYELIEIEKQAMAMGCKQSETKDLKKTKGKRETYTMYGPEVIYRLTEKYVGDVTDEKSETISITIGKKKKSFALRTYEHNNPYNPAFQVGYLKDATNRGETFVSIFHGADKLIKQLVWEVSELHLAKAMHGIMQKYVYAPACNHSRSYSPCSCNKQTCTTCYKGGNKVRHTTKETCNGGRYSNTQDTCTVCKGSGKNYHVTTQDIVVIRKPETKEQQAIPLSEMVHYAEIPVHILEMQEKSVKELERDIYKAALNFDLGSKEDVKMNETATGRILDMRGLYSVLGKLGCAVSEMYKHAVKVTAGYLQIHDNLKVSHSYPLDLRLDTIDDKIAQRKSALDAGLPSESINKIDESILALQCNGDSDALIVYKAWENWRPLSSKSAQERLSTLAMLDDDHPLKVLDIFFDQIRCEIREDLEASTPFCGLTWKGQKDVIDAKVAQYAAQYYGGEVEDETFAPDASGETASSGGTREGNTLAQSVGGSGLVSAISEDVAKGVITREAGINRAIIQLGYNRETAELLITEPPTSTPNSELV